MAVAAKRLGSRWFDGHPTSEEVAKWFIENARIHEGLVAADYVDGIVIISQEQTFKVARESESGARTIAEEKRMVHTPYMRVDTRIDYFWRWMALHPEWVGSIEPVQAVQVGPTPSGLPPGFARGAESGKDGKTVDYIRCTQRAKVIDREGGKTIFSPPPATKTVPVAGRWGPDDDMLEKAETGAVGRALGMLGVLVLGSGVASAEDMLDHQHAETGAAEAAKLPAETDTGAGKKNVLDEIQHKISQLESDSLEEVRSWARGRKIDLDAIKPDQSRAVLRRLDTALAEALASGAGAEHPDADDPRAG